jgi:cytoskeletal protein CcmA (bactofilin family)
MSSLLQTRIARWLLMPLVVAALVFGVVGQAQALEIKSGGTVAAGEVVNDDVLLFGSNARVDGTINGNLIASGNDVTINGTVNGDVIVWSNTATINGTINGNLFLAGNTAEVNAPVKGTAYLAGNSFKLGSSATVERNLFFAGFSLVAQAGSKVGTDALVTGYQYLLSGQVGRDVLADVAALQIDGQVGRNVKANVAAPNNGNTAAAPVFYPSAAAAPVPPGIRVAETAAIGGTLTYTSTVNQDTAVKAVPAGGKAFVLKADTTVKPVAAPLAAVGQAAVASMRDFLTLLALGALVLWLRPATAQRVVERAQAALLPSAGWGFVTFVGGYVALFVIGLTLLIVGILLAIVTFGGLAGAVLGVGLSTLGAVFAAFSLLVTYGSKLVVAYLVGLVVLKALTPHGAENRFWTLAVGVLIYVVIRDVPPVIPVVGGVFGWLVGAVATLVGLGALWLVFRDWWAARHPAAPAPVAPAPVAPAQP